MASSASVRVAELDLGKEKYRKEKENCGAHCKWDLNSMDLGKGQDKKEKENLGAHCKCHFNSGRCIAVT